MRSHAPRANIVSPPIVRTERSYSDSLHNSRLRHSDAATWQGDPQVFVAALQFSRRQKAVSDCGNHGIAVKMSTTSKLHRTQLQKMKGTRKNQCYVTSNDTHPGNHPSIVRATQARNLSFNQAMLGAIPSRRSPLRPSHAANAEMPHQWTQSIRKENAGKAYLSRFFVFSVLQCVINVTHNCLERILRREVQWKERD
jgi:hypothetical protein